MCGRGEIAGSARPSGQMDFDDSLFGEGSEDRGSDSSVVLEDAGKHTKKPYVARVCDQEVQGRHYWASVSDVASLHAVARVCDHEVH